MSNATASLSYPKHILLFDVEKNIALAPKREWLQNNWHYSFYYAIIYVTAIYFGKRYMKSRQPFEIRKWLLLWNLSLCLFSAAGAMRTMTELVHTLSLYGFNYSVCNTSYLEGVTGIWIWLSAMSKLIEFGDTAFIILRKQKLIFLHWYHHLVTFLYCWFTYCYQIAPPRWFVSMNYLTHFLMYGYYSGKALKFKIPRSVSITITTVQITQIAIGCFVILWSHWLYTNGVQCAVNNKTTIASFLLYFTNFILFAKFFSNSYLRQSVKGNKQKAN